MALVEGPTLKGRPAFAGPGPSAGLPPVGSPALQRYGIATDMKSFNRRVQRIVDAHERAHGYRPTPGLVFDIARANVPEGRTGCGTVGPLFVESKRS